MGELDNLTNSILQLKAKKTGITTGRIVMNTIFGIGGLIDVATPIGLERQNEDFGQTLGHYGVGEGPFFVIPVLGPSNIRDTGGLAFDSAVFYAVDPFNFDHNEDLGWIYRGVGAVDARHQNEFRYYRSGSPFEYDMIRLFLHRRTKNTGRRLTSRFTSSKIGTRFLLTKLQRFVHICPMRPRPPVYAICCVDGRAVVESERQWANIVDGLEMVCGKSVKARKTRETACFEATVRCRFRISLFFGRGGNQSQ